MHDQDTRALASVLVKVAREAGRAIMAHYRAPIAIELKSDASPVTAADREAEAIILEGLSKAAPGILVIAEEAMAATGLSALPSPLPDVFFLVDPLDGTKEFINARDEFTVNIALIERGAPVFGLVYAPALSVLYVTTGTGTASELRFDPAAPEREPNSRPIRARLADTAALSVVASHSHMNTETKGYIDQYKVSELKNAGSSLKFCLLACGEADLYPRLGPTMEWDTAAGHAVLAAAGGTVSELDGRPLRYGNTGRRFLNPYFVAWGRRV